MKPTRLTAHVSTDPDVTLDLRRAEAAAVLAGALLECDASRRLAAWVAGDACLVIELPTGDREDAALDLSLAARAQRASADAVSELLDGLADGHLDAVEAERLEAAAERMARAALSLREVARRAKRERGVRLSVVGVR